MVVIDGYVEVGPGLQDDDLCALRDVTVEAILASLTAAGVDRAVIAPANWGPSNVDPDYEASNSLIAEVVAGDRAQSVGLARINPRYGEQAVKAAERWLGEYGLAGIAFKPESDGYRLADHDLIAPILSVADAHGGIVVFHLGSFHYPSTQPIHALSLAERFPEVTMVLGHVGNRVSADAVMVAERCPNVKLLTCGMPSLALRNLAGQFGESQLMFASDAPYGVPGYEVTRVREIPGVDESVLSAIMGGTLGAAISR